MSFAPWSTRKSDAAFRARLLALRKEFSERNPDLGAQLRGMSDADLATLETSLLQLMPSSPDVAYQLRCLKDAAIWRAAPKRKGRIERYRPASARAEPNGAISPAPDIGRSPTPETAPTDSAAASADPAPADPSLAAPKPDNVVALRPFGKCFHGGRELGRSRYWVEP